MNYFRMLRIGRLNKKFSPRTFINISKNVTKIKLLFTNMPFRHDSACLIQKGLRLDLKIPVIVNLIQFNVNEHLTVQFFKLIWCGQGCIQRFFGDTIF